MKYLLGFLGVCLPVFLYLYFQGAVAGFISQLFYYSRAFSSGYFNTPVDRQFQSAYLHWHIFNQYVSSDNPILWEITKLTIFGSFLFSGFKLITGKITPSERLVFVVSLFSLGLFRSALGRSDFYHLLPLVWLALLLIVHYLNKFTPLLLVFLLLIFARVPINANYSENYIYRLQTYGRQIGEWRNFTTPRSGLLLGNTVDTYTLNDIVKYISENSQPSDSVFIYPWDPELYFLADRKNSTSLDTPYAFFTPEYQQQTIRELQMHPPKFIVYNPQKYFGGMTPGWLPLLTSYITSTYSHPAAVFGKYQILTL